MADHRANLEQNLSRFMTHTKSSEPKFAAERRPVVPVHSTHFVGEGGNAAAGAPRMNQQESVRSARDRNFGGSQVFAAIRGNNDGALPSPGRGGTATPDGPPAGGRTNSPGAQNREAGGLYRHGSSNRQHYSVHGTLPQLEEKPQQRMWLAKPLSNGARHMPMKRRYDSPSRASALIGGDYNNARTNESPLRGKRQIARPDSINGCDVNVVTEPRAITPHRLTRYHGTKAPYLTARSPSTDRPAGGPSSPRVNMETGLTGYGPTGKKTLAPEGEGMGILDHPQPRSASEARALAPPPRDPPRGPQMFVASGHSSVPWDLKSYTAEQLNEKKWRPCSVTMHGAPAFHPTNSPGRSRGISSPGRRRVDPGDSNIFPMPHEVPNLRNPHSVAAGGSPGRTGTGRYSPLRQQPPSSYPTST